MLKSRSTALLLTVALAMGATIRAEEPEGKSRLKLEPAAEVPTHHVAVDPYDDLGDFVATYTVRLRRPSGLPPAQVQDLNWGTYHARRQGDWVSFSYDLEQPEAVPEGGLAAIPSRESWIWFRNQFEGVLDNNILTLDPSDHFPDGPLPPFMTGLYWRIDGPDERPVLQPPGPGDEARRAGLGWLPFTTTDLGDGTVEEFSMKQQPEGTLGDGTVVTRFQRRIRSANPAAGEERRIISKEHGVRVVPTDPSQSFDLLFSREEVPVWRGKFPAEIRFVRYQVPDFETTDNTWQKLRARRDRSGSIDTIMSEYHMVLVDVRTPRADDPIEMRDFRSRIVAIRNGRHDAVVEDVVDDSVEGAPVVNWVLDEGSQTWSRATTP